VPELPDVEVFKRYVDVTSLHQKIRSVGVRNEKILGVVSASKLQSTLKGRAFESTRRHGKNLFVELDDGGWMLMHFGMTGDLAYFENPDDEPPHSRVLFTFENGYHLALDDGRMFGKVDLIAGPEDFARERELGPDPLKLDAATFLERFRGKRGGIKATLMNQKILAGIGNLYSDEILFQARIHPRTSVAQLDDPTLEKLHEETLRVLKTAIEQEAYPQELPDSFLLSHRREGERCPRGNGEIQKVKAAGRTAYFCPTCQPEPDNAGQREPSRA
jgi:formamidopyrimidine-DNA glycosylase